MDRHGVLFREFVMASEDYFRSGVKPDWLQVNQGRFACELADTRAKSMSKEKQQAHTLWSWRVKEAVRQVPELLQRFCLVWVTLGYCRTDGKWCNKEHLAEFQGAEDAYPLDNVMNALNRLAGPREYPDIEEARKQYLALPD